MIETHSTNDERRSRLLPVAALAAVVVLALLLVPCNRCATDPIAPRRIDAPAEPAVGSDMQSNGSNRKGFLNFAIQNGVWYEEMLSKLLQGVCKGRSGQLKHYLKC